MIIDDISIFDPQYVYCVVDSKLEKKIKSCKYIALSNTINSLIDCVEEANLTTSDKLCFNIDDLDSPFSIYGIYDYAYYTFINYKFCYADPFIEYKIAFKRGKLIEYKTICSDTWIKLDDFAFSPFYEYRIVDLMTNKQLSEWLSKGLGVYQNITHNVVSTKYSFKEKDSDNLVSEKIRIKYYDKTNWIKPTIDLLDGKNE